MSIPQLIKTRLAELAAFPEKYTLAKLAAELEWLSVLIKEAERRETELTQSALKIE